MSAVPGTQPRGTENEQQAAAFVRGMFGRVAPRYDLLNHVLSFQVDRYWRAQTVRALRPILDDPRATVLDLACGTGDLTLALAEGAKARVLGSDFCHPMLERARKKGAPRLFEADALCLPLAAGSVDCITAAFGFRNFTNYRGALRELRRVIKPGGTLAILEFSTPPNPVFNALYQFYSRRVLPAIGGLISGAPDAYTYLPESVSKFPEAETLAAEMRACGFADASFRRFTFGIAALHLGR